MTGPESSPHARYVRFIARRAWIILGVAFVITAGGFSLVRKLELRAAFSELLPSDDPGVKTMERTQARMGDLSLLLVGIRSPDRAANLRYAAAVTERLLRLPKSVCEIATYHLRDLKDFFEANKWMYIGEPDLENIRDRLKREIAKQKNPLLLDLGDDEANESPAAMKDRLTKQDRLGGKFPGGYFSNADGTYVWVAALTPSGQFGEHAGSDLLKGAEKILTEIKPATFHAQMVAQAAGPIVSLVENREAIERDIMWVTITCAVLVALVIGLYFGRKRAIPLATIPAIAGTIMAFATARVVFGYVNSSTAFLGSIILGNGINYAIILISRYFENRGAGQIPQEALTGAIKGVFRGTLVACVCASGAYASLMLTSFRGFYQFGVMGAVGVVFCWIGTFTILPALIVLVDTQAEQQHRRPPLHFGALGRLLVRRARWALAISVLVTIGTSYGLLHFLDDPFEYSFGKLSARIERTESAEQFNESHESLFGRWPSPSIVLADNVNEVESIKTALRRQDEAAPGDPVVGRIVTINDVLPGTPEVQRRKLLLLDQIRKLARDKTLDALTEEERKPLRELEVPDGLRVLEAKELPPLVRRPFTEVDGTIGRVVLAYPPEEGISVWNGKSLLRIANVMQRIELLPEHKVIETSGSAVVFASMIRSILRDGPRATVASLFMVVALAFLVMRPVRASAIALSSLLVGVVWMVGFAGLVGIAGLAEVKITFLNFIALPITFGVGVEYALNVVARDQEAGDMEQAIASTGGAVALCSLTTIIGYGSLLAARNRALQGFGAMAILGEVACLAAAIVALPAVVLWRRQRRAGKI